MAYFPAFIEIEKKPVLIIGEGKHALQKVKVMEDFGAKVICLEKEWSVQDLEGMHLVIAATGDRRKNHEIAEACRERGILVNAVDQQEDCDFIFPSYIKQGDVVAAFSSSGKSPLLTQYLKKEMRPILTEKIGSLNDVLGSLREMARASIDSEEKRKLFYQMILEKGLEDENGLTEAYIYDIIAKMREA